MEIFTGGEGELIFRKYSPIEEMGNLASSYAQAMAQTLGCLVCIADQDQIIAASGTGQTEYLGKSISTQMEELMETRQTTTAGQRLLLTKDETNTDTDRIISPILAAGDVIGAVALIQTKAGEPLGEAERKQVMIAAGFLGGQMEV